MNIYNFFKNFKLYNFVYLIISVFLIFLAPYIINFTSNFEYIQKDPFSLLSLENLNNYFNKNEQIDKLKEINQNFNKNNPPTEYFRAEVVDVTSEKITDTNFKGNQLEITKEEIIVKPLNGNYKDILTKINRDITDDSQNPIKVKIGDEVVVGKAQTYEGNYFFIFSFYRLNSVIFLIIIFIIAVLILTGFRGINAFLSLIISIIFLIQFLLPSILSGYDPLIITFVTGIILISIALPLGHGFNKKTLISWLSSVITIIIALLISIIVVEVTKLTGNSSEETANLQFLGLASTLNLKGILLGSVVIGILGILDDVTTTQAVTVQQISIANPNYNFKELYLRGLKVGQEHIISLINTLGLAYIGSSLPLLLLFTISNNAPIWVNLNNEFVVEEIVRTLVGSFCLLLAVPIVNFMASKWLKADDKPKDYVPLTEINKRMEKIKIKENNSNRINNISDISIIDKLLNEKNNEDYFKSNLNQENNKKDNVKTEIGNNEDIKNGLFPDLNSDKKTKIEVKTDILKNKDINNQNDVRDLAQKSESSVLKSKNISVEKINIQRDNIKNNFKKNHYIINNKEKKVNL